MPVSHILALKRTSKSAGNNNQITKYRIVILFAGLQVGNLDLVEEPALQFALPGVVVPDTQERQRTKTSLRAEDEVHDASSNQLLHTTAHFKHGT